MEIRVGQLFQRKFQVESMETPFFEFRLSVCVVCVLDSDDADCNKKIQEKKFKTSIGLYCNLNFSKYFKFVQYHIINSKSILKKHFLKNTFCTHAFLSHLHSVNNSA